MAIEIHFDKRISNSTVVREVDMRQRRHYAFLTLLAGLFLAGLLFYGWQQYRYLNDGYDVVDARKAHQKLKDSNDRLVVERARWGSLERVAIKARKDLGMIDSAGHWLAVSPELPAEAPSAAKTPRLALAAEE